MSTESFLSLIRILIVLFLMLMVGFFARKKGIIDTAASKKLSALIVNIGQPAMIMNPLFKVDFEKNAAIDGLTMFLIGIGVHVFCCVFAFFAVKIFKDPDERKISEFSIIFANAGFIGFPILNSVFGDIGTFWGCFYIVAFHLFVWTWGMMILARGREDIKMTVKKALVNLGTVPCAIGVAFYLLTAFVEIPSGVRGVIVDCSGYLTNLCTPISVLIVGSLLATRSFKQIFMDKKVYFTCLCRLILIPVCVCLIAKVIGLSDDMVLFAALISALPSATNVTMFAELYEIVPGYAAQAVGVSSLFTFITLPCVMLFADFVVRL